MKFNDAVFGAILLVVGIAVLVHVQAFPKIPGQPVGPALFPGLVAVGLAACGLLLIASGLRHRAAQPVFAAEPWTRSKRHVVGVLAVVAAVAFYLVVAERLGFLLTGPLVLAPLFLVFGVRPRTAAVVAVAATLVIWFAFYKLLRVPLPWGVLQAWSF